MKKLSPKLQTLVVDNSLTQCTLLSKLVHKHPQLEMAGVYENALDTYRHLGESHVDLLLLDVEMPLISGFDLIDTLKEEVQVILVTANPQYALKAFEFGVTDYLLKPVDPLRFKTAIRKAVSVHRTKFPPVQTGITLDVRCDLEKRQIAIADLLWIEAMGDYVKLITEEEKIVILSTMKALIAKLPKDKFLRIHRSYIVNLEKVDLFNSTSVEIAGQKLPMSRSKSPRLEKLLQPLG